MSAQSFGELTTPPADTSDAKNLRIWLGLERLLVAQVKVEILSMQYETIRTLVDTSLVRGYYNFYWDKRDDSGNFVPEGKYVYRRQYGGDIKYGNLTVNYHPIGNKGILNADTLSKWPKVEFEIPEDSTLVSLKIADTNMEIIARPFQDSLYTKGKHEYICKPDKSVEPGSFYFIFEFDDVKDIVKVSYKR